MAITTLQEQGRTAAGLGTSRSQLQAIDVANTVQENACPVHLREAEPPLDSAVSTGDGTECGGDRCGCGGVCEQFSAGAPHAEMEDAGRDCHGRLVQEGGPR